MTMVCDRCGETFTLEEWNKMKRKIEVRPIIGGEEKWSVLLCPSCMAKLNDWLKGEQKWVRKFQTFCPSRWLSRLEEKENKNG